MHGDFWFQAFVYLCAAVVSVPIATRLGLGSVLGYLLAGVAIGPFALGLVGEEMDEVMHFAEFGVVMMLFLIGLELRPALLWTMRGPILGLGGLQVALTSLLLAGIALLFGLAAGPALAVGMTLALSSTAIVLQTFTEKGLLQSPAGRSGFAVLLFQDIAVIPMLALLPLLAVAPTAAPAGGADDHAAPGGWQGALLVVGAVLAVVVGGRFLSRPVFRFIARARMREVFTAAALLLVVGISLAMVAVGLSPALGAFLAGVVLADNEYRHELEADIEPFKGLLLGLFFLSVGAGVDFALLADRPGTIAGMVLLLVAVKLLVLAALGRLGKLPRGDRLLFAFALAQGGEFAFVLLGFANQSGVLGDAETAPLIAVVALSMLLTPLLLIVEERLLRPRLAAERPAGPEPAPMIEHHDPAVVIAGFGNFGQAVGRLLRANGIEATVLDLDPGLIAMLDRLGMRVHYGDASRVELLEAAGAARARLLVVAVGDHDKTVEIVRRARQAFGHLQLLVRARGRHEAYELLEMGVTQVYRESLGTALELGVDALRRLGVRGHAAYRAAALFQRHDEAAMRELAAHSGGDRATYVSLARQRIELLERALREDRERLERDQDAGWDPPGAPEQQGDSAAADRAGS